MSKTDTTAKKQNSMATFFKVLRFIGKYRFLLVLSVILAAVTVILQLYVPVLFGYAIDEVVATHEVDFTRMGFYLSRILVMIVLSGIAIALASIVYLARLTAAQPTAGQSYEMEAVAATVIGGTSIAGGEGGIFGTVIGAVIVTVIRNGLVQLGVGSYFTTLVVGVIIIAAVSLDVIRTRIAANK